MTSSLGGGGSTAWWRLMIRRGGKKMAKLWWRNMWTPPHKIFASRCLTSDVYLARLEYVHNTFHWGHFGMTLKCFADEIFELIVARWKQNTVFPYNNPSSFEFWIALQHCRPTEEHDNKFVFETEKFFISLRDGLPQFHRLVNCSRCYCRVNSNDSNAMSTNSCF